MYCPRCGKELPDVAKVCGYCGHRLPQIEPGEAAPPAEAPAVPIAPAARPARRNPYAKVPLWVWAGVGILAAAAAIFLIVRQTLPTVGSTRISKADGMEMVYVPGGEFTMGMKENKAANRPEHTVVLDSYWIDRTEVTNAMYGVCVESESCAAPKDSAAFDDPGLQDHPVVFVDRQMAEEYCAWAGRRLPTEAEWEKAARGTDGRLYPWGNAAPDRGLLNFGRYIGGTIRVGSYPSGASPYGALDMAGNVYEWVADWFGEDYYRTGPKENPPGPDSGTLRLVRGGSWLCSEECVNSVFRHPNDPANAGDNLGFHCALSA
ncbi:MAG: SUMF1/EgtB/PvdO family nonheme iron enzyme [Anaerolineales bacterium]|nr:SUMF1/EgtB/PvdO family nonheme iron enzyme [Anaerolineales bacterium]